MHVVKLRQTEPGEDTVLIGQNQETKHEGRVSMIVITARAGTMSVRKEAPTKPNATHRTSTTSHGNNENVSFLESRSTVPLER